MAGPRVGGGARGGGGVLRRPGARRAGCSARASSAAARPARWYAACEAAIGAVEPRCSRSLMAPVSERLLASHRRAAVAGAGSGRWPSAARFVLLLPATAAMGATLPAMERCWRDCAREGSSIAALYAGNTFGARARRARRRVLAGAGIRPRAHRRRVRGAEPALRRAGAEAVPAPRQRAAGRRSAARWRAGASAAAGRHRAARHRLRGARRPRAQPGRREHRLHLRACCSRSTCRHRARRRGVPPLAAPTRRSGRLRDRAAGALAAACLLGTLSLWAAETVKALCCTRSAPSMAAALAAEARSRWRHSCRPRS